MTTAEAIIVNMDTWTLDAVADVGFIPTSKMIEFFNEHGSVLIRHIIQPPDVVNVRELALNLIYAERAKRHVPVVNVGQDTSL
jgi:hypothetical protein